MKKYIVRSLLSLALCLSFVLPTYALEGFEPVEVTLDAGSVVGLEAQLKGGVSYLPFGTAVMALRPDAQVVWEEGRFIASAEDFTMSVRVGERYLVINERYLYIADGVLEDADGDALVPSRVLASALGAGVNWSGKVELTSGGTPLTAEGKPYDEETLDILARVIMHESGYQPFLGQLAVGSVIMNRVASDKFPNTVSEVIYAPNQFPGATNATPGADAILAARLCLEGANVVPGAYYFNGVGKSCWASRNKSLICTIGGHSFYG